MVAHQIFEQPRVVRAPLRGLLEGLPHRRHRGPARGLGPRLEHGDPAAPSGTGSAPRRRHGSQPARRAASRGGDPQDRLGGALGVAELDQKRVAPLFEPQPEGVLVGAQRPPHAAARHQGAVVPHAVGAQGPQPQRHGARPARAQIRAQVDHRSAGRLHQRPRPQHAAGKHRGQRLPPDHGAFAHPAPAGAQRRPRARLGAVALARPRPAGVFERARHPQLGKQPQLAPKLGGLPPRPGGAGLGELQPAPPIAHQGMEPLAPGAHGLEPP